MPPTYFANSNSETVCKWK